MNVPLTAKPSRAILTIIHTKWPQRAIEKTLVYAT
jgi:hypothetical protein